MRRQLGWLLILFLGRCFWKIDDGVEESKEEMTKGNNCNMWTVSRMRSRHERGQREKIDTMHMLFCLLLIACNRHGHIFSLPGCWYAKMRMPYASCLLCPWIIYASIRPAAYCCSWWRERERGREICVVRQIVDGRWMRWYGGLVCTQTDRRTERGT